MSKKLWSAWLCMLTAAMILFSGCAVTGMDISVSKTGSGNLFSTVRLNKTDYIEYLRKTYSDMGMESDAEDIVNDEIEQGVYTEETIDGVEYLVMTSSEEDTEFESITDFYSQLGLNSGYELTETSFCISGKSLMDEETEENDYFDSSAITEEEMQHYLSNSYLELSVGFDYPVAETNGIVDPENPNKVSWRYALTEDVDKIYAYCDSSISFSGVVQGSVSQEPVTLHFEGVQSATCNGQQVENDTVFSVDGSYQIILKNGEEQKTVYFVIDRTAPELLDDTETAVSWESWVKKEQVVYLLDEGGILSAELDGEQVLECSLTGNEEFVYYVTVTPEKLADGKHTLIVQDSYGNKNEISFKTDGTAPKVTGIKHKKTYKKAVKIKFSDNVSGIKKATLNGKKVKSGKKVKAAGTYTLKVTDKAGNVTKVKFKIKEKKVKKVR